jgi:large subunit ribosomal protein L24
MYLRANDTVEVIAGDDKGSRGKVLRVDRTKGRLVVEGINRAYKHVRRSQKNPQGGRLSRELPVQISNVLLLCTKCGRGVRVGARLLDNGSKERYCKKCGVGLGQVSAPKAARAKKK